MCELKITTETMRNFEMWLIEEEKSDATIQKYKRDVLAFYEFLPEDKVISKKTALSYKNYILPRYKESSTNSMLISLNIFFAYIGASDCRLKLIRVQRETFATTKKELTKEEYKRLLAAAKHVHNERLYLLLQSICSTGIRVSEHQYITVEALYEGRAMVNNKGKTRYILIPEQLRKMLIRYCKAQGIKSGPVFVTKGGKPIDRSNIWKSMKALCHAANVEESKVFPHNLRHLFAFTYYSLQKDVVRLADILGHSSVETTRIYTKTTINDCERSLGKMGLVGLIC